MPRQLTIIAIEGLPEIQAGDALAEMIVRAAEDQDTPLSDGDVVVVAQKAVSKAEGRVVRLEDVAPSSFARQIGLLHDRDPRLIETILGESRRIVRMDKGVLITETHHGFVCANAGVDASNLPGDGNVCLLPKDPDASAQGIRASVRHLTGAQVAVIVADTFGRPWREGTTDVAIGVAGFSPLKDYRGAPDAYGHLLRVTVVAVADELAGAADLVRAKASGVPAVIVRGLGYEPAEDGAGLLVRAADTDLFR